MDPKRRQWMVIAAALAAVGAAVIITVLSHRDPQEEARSRAEVYFICRNPSCRAEFSTSLQQIMDYHRSRGDRPMACPKCKGEQTVRAARCLACGRNFEPGLRGQGRSGCPYCGKKATGEGK